MSFVIIFITNVIFIIPNVSRVLALNIIPLLSSLISRPI